MGVLDSFRLDGKVALVTGGAGLYGRQIVASPAEAGAKVFVASRNLEALEKVAAAHREKGEDVNALQVDQGDEESILALRDKLLDAGGRLDVLVNNAVARPLKNWGDDLSAFAESMRINATGLFAMTRAFGDEMQKRRSGSIINIGSIQGMVGPDGTIYRGSSFHGFAPDYFFHKGGMLNFTRFVASYYGEDGVRCNCVSPGGFFNNQGEPFVTLYSERTLLGRMANNTDLKGAVVFLASDASAYVTGANLAVDGGYTAK